MVGNDALSDVFCRLTWAIDLNFSLYSVHSAHGLLATFLVANFFGSTVGRSIYLLTYFFDPAHTYIFFFTSAYSFSFPKSTLDPFIRTYIYLIDVDSVHSFFSSGYVGPHLCKGSRSRDLADDTTKRTDDGYFA